ncbi:MAG: hypothetical protein QM802_08985 [Agriterribacter sp.]
MKKLLVILAMGAFAACNSGETTPAATVDTNTAKPADTMVVKPADTTAPKAADTTKPADTTKK